MSCELKDQSGKETHLVGTLGFFEVYGNAVPQAKVTFKSDNEPLLDGIYIANWDSHSGTFLNGDLAIDGGIKLIVGARFARNWREGAMVAVALRSNQPIYFAGFCKLNLSDRVESQAK